MQRWLSWMHRVIALGAPGVGAVVLLHGPTLVVSLVMIVSFFVTFAHLARSDDGERTSGRAVFASIVRTTACVVTVLCCVGLAESLHPAAALLLVGGLTVTSPPLRERAARLAGLAPIEPIPGAPPAPRDVNAVKDLTDAELQRAWCHTAYVLRCTTDPTRRLDLVIIRQHLLDEVWTRDRAALERWVADGARAHDRPSRYFDPS
jgi:hypothetical protein